MQGVNSSSWFVWALGSAGFAALTAIFAKIGVEGINSDLSTLFRTLVIVVVLTALLDQGHVSGIFVDDRLGAIAGTLPLSSINLKGSALPPVPSIVVNFRTGASDCAIPTNCQVEMADNDAEPVIREWNRT